MAYGVSSHIPLLTTRLAATGVASSSIKSSSRKVKEVTRGERESSADALSCRSWCCLFLVLCWPSCRPDKYRQSSLHMCMYAVHYAAGVALAWLPISQQVFSKGDGSLPMWTSGERVYVTELLPGRVPRSAVDRLRAGSRARGRAAYTPTRSSGCTQTRFRTSACGQAASEERL